jgi:hypothetical protein
VGIRCAVAGTRSLRTTVSGTVRTGAGVWGRESASAAESGAAASTMHNRLPTITASRAPQSEAHLTRWERAEDVEAAGRRYRTRALSRGVVGEWLPGQVS